MMNISDWIQEWSFLQPHKKALIFEEPPKTASGKIQTFILKETHGNPQIPSAQ
jgi:acyl-coenzyme A synthetase/AMP-(fatty) acid ligase